MRALSLAILALPISAEDMDARKATFSLSIALSGVKFKAPAVQNGDEKTTFILEPDSLPVLNLSYAFYRQKNRSLYVHANIPSSYRGQTDVMIDGMPTTKSSYKNKVYTFGIGAGMTKVLDYDFSLLHRTENIHFHGESAVRRRLWASVAAGYTWRNLPGNPFASLTFALPVSKSAAHAVTLNAAVARNAILKDELSFAIGCRL